MISAKDAAVLSETVQAVLMTQEAMKAEAKKMEEEARYKASLKAIRSIIEAKIRSRADLGLRGAYFDMSEYEPTRHAAFTVANELMQEGYEISYGTVKYSDDAPSEDQMVIKW